MSKQNKILQMCLSCNLEEIFHLSCDGLKNNVTLLVLTLVLQAHTEPSARPYGHYSHLIIVTLPPIEYWYTGVPWINISYMQQTTASLSNILLESGEGAAGYKKQKKTNKEGF